MTEQQQQPRPQPQPEQQIVDRGAALMEWSPFLAMDQLDDSAIMSDLEGRTFKVLVYEFRQGDDMVQGLGIKGIDAAAEAMARQGYAIREDAVDCHLEGEYAYFKARVSLYRIATNPQTGEIREVLTVQKLGSKRQWLKLKRRDGRLQDNPFWYETGSSKALRNATARLIPERVKQEIIARAQKENAVSRVSAPQGPAQPRNTRGQSNQPSARRTAAQAAPWKPTAAKGEQVETDKHPMWATHLALVARGKELTIPLVETASGFKLPMSATTLESFDHALEIAIADREADQQQQLPIEGGPETPSEEPSEGAAEDGGAFVDDEPATDDQKNMIYELSDQLGIEEVSDPETGDRWVIPVIDWESTSAADADRIRQLLHASIPIDTAQAAE